MNPSDLNARSKAGNGKGPDVRLINAFREPYRNVIAAAKTCYASKGPVLEVALTARDREIARSIYRAGHHTTYQHPTFQFVLDRVSRHFLWSFLHSHPFYNSEQVSQRYVEVKPGRFVVPPIKGPARTAYLQTVEAQIHAYQKLNELLEGPVSDEYYSRFEARRWVGGEDDLEDIVGGPTALQFPFTREGYKKEIKKKCQEIARYVLPVSIHAYLYHTVSGLTLFRYRRLCLQHDVPHEQRLVVEKMVERVVAYDPNYAEVFEDPLPLEETPEARFFSARKGPADPAAFIERFDGSLNGAASRLTDWKANAEEILAESVRETLGALPNELSDDEAIRLALDPAANGLLGESLNLTTHSKISRALFHAHYTFRKKISHTADSQDQRHRMTPASRPCLAAHLTDEPDYITPFLLERARWTVDLAESKKRKDGLVKKGEENRRKARVSRSARQISKAEKTAAQAVKTYDDAMRRAWDGIARLKKMGVSEEYVQYLLPNAVAIRFSESADLLNLRHKHLMRLCYNAQEEIWRASLDEARQISEKHPRIGRWLLPPCTARHLAKTRPICPEGERYCGVPVWKLDLSEYERAI